ncbi:MAG: alpha/beta hydrolase [Fimbriimonas sp.]|nr:alpha/beta hydrolase [Fimbriimonas sp.]
MSSSQQQVTHPLLTLWPTGNPGGWTRTDQESQEKSADSDFLIVKSVSKPTLEVFRSKSAKPGAPTVLICPGGGYFIEAIEHEGWEIATRLNLAGIHAAVLKYRLPNREQDKPLHKVVLQDTQRALRLLRSHATEYGLTPNRIGIMGFSAGGHAAAVTSTTEGATYLDVDSTDKLDYRPDFTVLIYPAYLNRPDTLDLVPELSVTSHTPSAFIVQAMDDPIPIEGSLAYTHACHVAKVPVELHLFPHGGHGYGLRTHEPGLQTWPDLLIAWLDRLSK